MSFLYLMYRSSSCSSLYSAVFSVTTDSKVGSCSGLGQRGMMMEKNQDGRTCFWISMPISSMVVVGSGRVER